MGPFCGKQVWFIYFHCCKNAEMLNVPIHYLYDFFLLIIHSLTFLQCSLVGIAVAADRNG